MNLRCTHKQLCTKQLLPWRSFPKQLVSVNALILCFLLVQLGVYNSCGWLQAMLSSFSYISSTSEAGGPSQVCWHSQKGLSQFFDAFNTEMQCTQSHKVPEAKQHVNAALAYDKLSHIRKQILRGMLSTWTRLLCSMQLLNWEITHLFPPQIRQERACWWQFLFWLE